MHVFTVTKKMDGVILWPFEIYIHVQRRSGGRKTETDGVTVLTGRKEVLIHVWVSRFVNNSQTESLH